MAPGTGSHEKRNLYSSSLTFTICTLKFLGAGSLGCGTGLAILSSVVYSLPLFKKAVS